MPMYNRLCSHLIALLPVLFCGNLSSQHIDGELRVWHKITLTFDGPEAEEAGIPNPFSDYRLMVTFSQDSILYHVPGYFAADGNAAETGAKSGNKWRVHFAPDRTGEWHYSVAFHAGPDIAVSDEAGEALAPDGMAGTFVVLPTDKTGTDFRAKGRLQYTGERYLRHAGTGAYFLKTGADSPETLLAYEDFDNTSVMAGGAELKTWSPHLADWMPGDPVWRDSLGKGLIGAVNYLAAKGQNAISFIPMNIDGDGRNVWPYVAPDVFDRFDCSKLDQWEIVFTHCDHRGLYLHFKTQEEENSRLLDGGALGRTRKLYYRELVARYAHHLALNWNLGEENINTDAERKAFAQYFRHIDPYDHHIVVHTFPGSDEFVYAPMLGNQSALTGVSLQTDWNNVHALTRKWVNLSRDAGKPWVVANDEQGPAFIGVPDDTFAAMIRPTQDDIRSHVLWGNLMAGGAGVEYFFGYALPHHDMNCEDFRSRDMMWDYNRIATQFFHTYLPFWRMHNADSLITGASGDAYCFALHDTLYAIYLQTLPGGEIDLRDATGTFEVTWFNPRTGGTPEQGTISIITSGGLHDPGAPVSDPTGDWVCLLRKTGIIPEIPVLDWAPRSCTRATLFWKYSGTLPTAIEMSTDGIDFYPLSVIPEIHCGEYCFAQITLPSAQTWYRLDMGGGFFTPAIRCTRPCAGERPHTGGEVLMGVGRGE